jgi:hypothetical protein
MIHSSEITDVTNKVTYLMAQSQTAPQRLDRDRSVAEALHISCELLSRLIRDDIYLEYERVRHGGNREALRIKRNLEFGAVELVSMDFSHFEAFLHRESQLLQSAGLEPDVTVFIIQKIQNRIDHLRRYQVSGPLLKRAIVRLHRHICEQSQEAKKALRRKRPFGNLVLGFGGVALIVINVVAEASLSPVGQSASAEIGGALVKDSVDTLIEEIWRR